MTRHLEPYTGSEDDQFNGTWGPRAQVQLWRDGKWVDAHTTHWLPVAVGVPAKYLRLGFTVYKGGVVGSLWLCGLPSHSEPHFIAATAQWRGLWELPDEDIVMWPGWVRHPETGLAIRVEELHEHDGTYVKPEKAEAAA